MCGHIYPSLRKVLFYFFYNLNFCYACNFRMGKTPFGNHRNERLSLLIATGLLPVEDAMRVFSNPGPITVGAMFILSATLEKCGAIEWVAQLLVILPKLKLCYLIPLVVVSVGLPSAFINNAPVVVVCLPIVISLANPDGDCTFQAVNTLVTCCDTWGNSHTDWYQLVCI